MRSGSVSLQRTHLQHRLFQPFLLRPNFTDSTLLSSSPDSTNYSDCLNVPTVSSYCTDNYFDCPNVANCRNYFDCPTVANCQGTTMTLWLMMLFLIPPGCSRNFVQHFLIKQVFQRRAELQIWPTLLHG